MVNTQLYEKIVKQKTPRAKLKIILSIVLYLLYLFVWAIIGLLNLAQAPLFFTLGILSCLIIVLISWKYLFIEYEYSFCMSTMTVSKIFGKRKRKTLAQINLSKCLIIAPATEQSIEKAEQFKPEKRIVAISNRSAENIWLILSDDKEDNQYLIFIESEPRIASIFQTFAPHIVTKKI